MRRVPHRCPVCEGRGFLPSGFYAGASSASTAPEGCRSCRGTGVVWSRIRRRPPDEPFRVYPPIVTPPRPSTSELAHEVSC